MMTFVIHIHLCASLQCQVCGPHTIKPLPFHLRCAQLARSRSLTDVTPEYRKHSGRKVLWVCARPPHAICMYIQILQLLNAQTSIYFIGEPALSSFNFNSSSGKFFSFHSSVGIGKPKFILIA